MFNSFTAHQTLNKERKLESRDNMALETAHKVIGLAHWHRQPQHNDLTPDSLAADRRAYLSYKVFPIMKENSWWEHNENRLVFQNRATAS